MTGEFDFIRNLRLWHKLGHVGDDCAVLPIGGENDLLATADLLVEDVDFRLDWSVPEFIGHKALAVSLSDIAAMGGTPRWALTSIAVPERLWKTDFLERFYSWFNSLAGQHGVELVGGDVSRTEDKFSVDSIVLGEAPKGKAVLRSGAKPGDRIFITGYIGGAAAGLRLLDSGHRYDDSQPAPLRHLLLRQLQPLPQVTTGKLLREYGLAAAMIDLSDGLSSDLIHVAHASGVGARIDSDLLPIDPAISAVFDSENEALDMALDGGEDFELLFTTRPDSVAAALDLGFHPIGEITDKTGIVELEREGKTTILEPSGFRHF